MENSPIVAEPLQLAVERRSVLKGAGASVLGTAGLAAGAFGQGSSLTVAQDATPAAGTARTTSSSAITV